MRRILLLVATGVFFTAIFAYSSQLPQKMWVSSRGATLKAGNSASSQTIADLKPGAALDVIAYENRWYKVQTPDGRSGWIYRGRVSTEQPELDDSADDGEDSLGDMLGDMSGSGIQADSADSSRSIRGLSPEAEAYANESGTPRQYRQALDEVLAVKVSSGEIERFLQQGKIGEYAE